MLKAFIYLIILLPFAAFAQFNLSGKAVSHPDKKPVANAQTIGQDSTSLLSGIVNKFEAFSSTHPTEKVYLHLDRLNYDIGDTIWFKAYVVTGGDHYPSPISGVLYTELINAKDSVVQTLTLQVNNGLANGDMEIPQKYDEGNYRIRAYTNWMRNESIDFFYNQSIRIGEGSIESANSHLPNTAASKKSAQNKIATGSNVDVQFFPEGGELVAGLRLKVAVKAVNAYGLGEDVTGLIVDNDGNNVANFSTQHLGMGSFALLPEEGKTYKAKILCKDGSAYTIELPKAKEEGFTITVNAGDADSVYVKIAANNPLFNKIKNTTFYLIARQDNTICYTAEANLAGPVYTTAIVTGRFKTGIAQFTLFSSSGEAVNERVAFVQNNDQLKLELNADFVVKPLQKMTFGLSAGVLNNQPVQGSFSVSVTDDLKVPENDEGTIFTHLLLNADLRGYIENPGYYFTNVNNKTRADLDLLMLTQGYRKLIWKQVLNNDTVPPVYKSEKGLELSGFVMTPSGIPVVNGKVSITSIGDRMVIDTLTATDGSFKFTNLNLPDDSKVIIKAAKPNNGKNVAIYIKQRDYPVVERRLNINEMMRDLSASQQADNTTARSDTGKTKMLKQVNIKDHKAPKPDRYNKYGTAYEYSVNLAQLKDFLSIKEAIGHKIPGVSIGVRGNLYYDGAYLVVMINGLTRPQNDLDIYNLSDIESIRIIDDRSPLLVVTMHPFTARDSIHIKLKEVKIKAKKEEKSDRSNQFGTDAPFTITAEKLKDMGPSLNPGLASKIAGVTYGGKGQIKSMEFPYPLLHIVLNNTVLADDDDINNYIRTDEVENIKVLRGMNYKVMYGIPYNPKLMDMDDIILITTKQFAGKATIESVTFKEINLKTDPGAKYVTTDLPTNLMSYKFKGYYKAREFYSPKYVSERSKQTSGQLETIYWNPDIITSAEGKASFEYFNAAGKGSYRLVVEGIDAYGNLGRQVFRYKVE